MEIFLVYFPSNRCLWGYGLPGRAWQLVNKDNRAGTQAVWKLLFFGACSLKFFIWTSASLRDIVMLFTTATKSYRKHYSLSFLPTSYSPLQNFATTDVCHNTYCCLSLCFPKKRIMSFREHHGKQASDFWLSEVTIYAILLLFLFLRETLNWEQGIVSK